MPAAPDNPTSRAHALDGLRGYAAIAVAFYHGILHDDRTLIPRVLHQSILVCDNLRDLLTKIALVLVNGEVAVHIFFVLSGAVLRLSLDRQRDQPFAQTAVSFAGVRTLRLYPPLIVCLLFYFGISQIGISGYPNATVSQLVSNMLLIDTRYHGPSATLQAEMLAVPFLLAAWMLRKHFGLPGLIVAFAYGLLATQSKDLVFQLPRMHGYLMAFMVGMLAAEPGLRPLMRDVPPQSWWIALALTVFCRAFLPHTTMTLAVMTMAAGFLVAGLLHGEPGSLSRFLERPVSQFLGRISYSVYLYNVPVLYFIWAFTDRHDWPKSHPLEAGLIVGAASLALTIPLAWASERWVEQASIRWGKRFAAYLRRLRVPPRASSTGA